MGIFFFSSSCNCFSPVICTCDMASPSLDMEALMTRLNNIMAKESKVLKEGESVQEALEMRVQKTVLQTKSMLWLMLVFVPGQVWIIRHCHREQLHKDSLLRGEDQHPGGGGACFVVAVVLLTQCCCQIEVPQCDVKPLGKESFLCKRITRPSTK